ncbi:YkgJ family cysteine cluster protein [Methanocella sp. MCL-LM]|uniref:YkgJ family cysteine cluster protein n=1 Tax=Methanocella sp. MCL-LM TaxID=3412035 RepID=UPI003C7351F0
MLSRQEFFTWARGGPYAQCSTEQLYFAYEVYLTCPMSRDPEHLSHADCGRCGNCCRRQWRIEVSLKDIRRWLDEGRIDILESLERVPPGCAPATPGPERSLDFIRTVESAARGREPDLSGIMAMVNALASGEASYVIPKTAGCKYLTEGEQTMCSIYDTRPEVCRNFPSVESA